MDFSVTLLLIWNIDQTA